MKRITAFFVLIMICLLAFSCTPGTPEATTLFSGKNPVAEDSDNGFSLYSASLSRKLTFYNTEYESASVTLYSDNGKSITVSAGKGERTVCDGIGGKLCAAELQLNGMEAAYALTRQGLDALLASDAERILTVMAIDTEELLIERPVSITAAQPLRAENIYYVSDSSGVLALSGDISCSQFASSAPKSEIDIPAELVPENKELYICAKSLNGEKVSADKRMVTSASELEMFCRRPAFYRNNKDVLVISGFELGEGTAFDFPCLIDVSSAEIKEKISIVTEEKGKIRIWGDVSYSELEINAPACDLVTDCVLQVDKAAKQFKVKSYNGFDIALHTPGGKCSDEILSATLLSEGNLLTEDIKWKVSGNKLLATVNGVSAPSQLENAVLSFETKNGGKVECAPASKGEKEGIDLLEPYGTFVFLTDGDGNTRRYKLITKIKATLPVVIIETDSGEPITTRFEYVSGKMTVEGDFADMESVPETAIEIKGRGNSTWAWSDKTPYKIKYPMDVSILGMEEGKDWVLLANYTDKALVRNTVALEAAKTLDNIECYATQYPVDVFFGGEYVGVYTIGEQIEVDDGRVHLVSDATDVDTGFFLEVGGVAEVDSDISFSTRYLTCVEILEPHDGSLTDKHKTYIKNYMKMADEAVSTLNGYEDYIDIDSLIDWFILTEISFNSDGAMRRSVFMKKDHGGKIEMCSVWDYDIAFGNAETDYRNYEAWCCLATEYRYVRENWMCHLMEDKEFVERLRLRWNEVKDELREVYMTSIDEAVGKIGISAEVNFKVWDIMDVQVAVQPQFMLDYNTYDLQVQYLRDFINARMDWIDSQLNTES